MHGETLKKKAKNRIISERTHKNS